MGLPRDISKIEGLHYLNIMHNPLGKSADGVALGSLKALVKNVIRGSDVSVDGRKELASWLISMIKKDALHIGNVYEQPCIVEQWNKLPVEIQIMILNFI